MRLSIGTKLGLGFGFVSLLTLLGTAVVSNSLMGVERATAQLSDLVGPTAKDVAEVRIEVASASASLRGLLLTTDNDARARYRQAWAALECGSQRGLRDSGIAATRQLAKRQLTWLRSMPARHVVACDAAGALPAALQALQRAAGRVA